MKEYINEKQETNEQSKLAKNIEDSHSSKKKYCVITVPLRVELIQKVLVARQTVKQSASELGIKFSTAKAIMKTFKNEGRIGKKKHRKINANVKKLITYQQEKSLTSEQQALYDKAQEDMKDKQQKQVTKDRQIQQHLQKLKIITNDFEIKDNEKVADSLQKLEDVQEENQIIQIKLQEENLNQVKIENIEIQQGQNHEDLIKYLWGELEQQRYVNKHLIDVITNLQMNVQLKFEE